MTTDIDIDGKQNVPWKEESHTGPAVPLQIDGISILGVEGGAVQVASAHAQADPIRRLIKNSQVDSRLRLGPPGTTDAALHQVVRIALV
jgi:hypothetical protein